MSQSDVVYSTVQNEKTSPGRVGKAVRADEGRTLSTIRFDMDRPPTNTSSSTYDEEVQEEAAGHARESREDKRGDLDIV